MPLILPNDIANGQLADGERLQQNNDVIENWANQEAITRDGATAMTGALLLSSATPTVPNQAVSKAYVDAIGTPSAYVWENYTPTLVSWTLGNGVATGRYIRIGSLIVFNARIVFGSTSVFTPAQPTISLPVQAAPNNVTENNRAIISVSYADSTAGESAGRAPIQATTCVPLVSTPSGASIADANLSSTKPFVWKTSDAIFLHGSYEAA